MNMGHFINWRFGVPVKVYAKSPAEYNYDSAITSGEVRLIAEDGFTFAMIFHYKKQTGCAVRRKQDYYYKLIPHKYGTFSPRYPVCQTPDYTAFCYDSDETTILDAGKVELKPFPIATLNINGKTIELSAETTAELKKKLGV